MLNNAINKIKLTAQGPKRERGQSLVEMSISITLLAVILAGVMDLGRAYYTYLALKDAANEGATYASIAPDDSSGIEARVLAESAGDNLVSWDEADIVTTLSGSACTGGEVEVEVEVQYQLIAPFIGGILGTQSLPLRASVVNTILQPTCSP